MDKEDAVNINPRLWFGCQNILSFVAAWMETTMAGEMALSRTNAECSYLYGSKEWIP